MAVELKRHRFTVDEYYQMAAAGILGEDDRVELIDGEIVDMTPIGPSHASHVGRVDRIFQRTFDRLSLVWVQNPVRLDEHTEPQPDLALLRPRADLYGTAHPVPTDIFLVVEIAATSAEPDRGVKVPLYGRAGIMEVWLLDLEQDTLTVYTDPGQEGYRTVRVARRGEQVAPTAFPNRPVAVADLLG